MRLKTYVGSNLPELFAQAQADIGQDAVLLSVRRRDADAGGFQIAAADPATARQWERKHTPKKPRPASRIKPVASPRDEEIVPSPQPRLARAPQPPSTGSLGDRPRIIALVGPTGSGKTTTIAKLATHPRIFREQRVGLLTLDTYRVGAVEELEMFARLAGIPMKMVYESRQIPGALRRLRGCEVILVDTPGRGPAAWEDVEAVQANLRLLGPDEVHLTVPAGLSPSRLRGLMETAATYRVTHVLPTKRDEDPDDEQPYALAEANNLPIRWIADGHRVPGDLHRAPARRVAPVVEDGDRGDDTELPYGEVFSGTAGVAH